MKRIIFEEKELEDILKLYQPKKGWIFEQDTTTYTVSDLQKVLKEKGFDIGKTGQNFDGIDNKFGKRTLAAAEKAVKGEFPTTTTTTLQVVTTTTTQSVTTTTTTIPATTTTTTQPITTTTTTFNQKEYDNVVGG